VGIACRCSNRDRGRLLFRVFVVLRVALRIRERGPR
jgi:hypothetical protein